MALLFTFLLSLLSTSVLAQSSPLNSPTIKIGIPPEEGEWRYFQRMALSDLKNLWEESAQSGKNLKDWSWQWRIGWMKVCQNKKDIFCENMLKQGLKDRAMVVRAEAVWGMSQYFEGTKNQEIIDLLSNAFAERNNFRGGKPLLVNYRILYAIDQIGGEESEPITKKLAATHKLTSRYFDKLTSYR